MTPETFLNTLWGDNPPGQALIWLNPPNTSRWYTGFHGVDEDIKAHAGSDIYTGVALAPPGSRGPNERLPVSDTTALAGLWADVDCGTTGHKKTNLPPTKSDAIAALEQLPFPPTIVINSGHGIQPWWLFEAPWTFIDPTDRALAQRLTRWWHHRTEQALAQHAWNLDATYDLPRVLRLPGTTNHKAEPVPVTVLSANGPRTNIHRFIHLLSISEQSTHLLNPPPQATQPQAEC